MGTETFLGSSGNLTGAGMPGPLQAFQEACHLHPPMSGHSPYTVMAIALFASGLKRSLQFSALNSLAFADVPPEHMSTTNTLANVVQQLTVGLGITAAAAAVHIAALLHREDAVGPTLADFRIAIVAAAIVTAVSTLDALTLSRDAGSLVSGHRPSTSKHENDLANSEA